MVRHAYWVERIVPELEAVREVAATDPPSSMLESGGASLTAFRGRRDAARARLVELEELIYPADSDD